jgi:hypothetical protein
MGLHGFRSHMRKGVVIFVDMHKCFVIFREVVPLCICFAMIPSIFSFLLQYTVHNGCVKLYLY